MHAFHVEQTASTPRIYFEAAERTLHIEGESYPENSFEFYAPVGTWLREYLAQQDELKLDINVSYLNSSSTKCMLDLLDLLQEAYLKGAKISLTWRYDQENPRSLDLAQEFQEEVTLPFTICSYQDGQA
jgi:hypothetical protein